MVDNFLVPLSMENMAKAFIEHEINGAVLLALTEEHMKELTCAVLGQRILFLEYLALLKRHKRDADRSKTLWSVTTPKWGKPSHHHRCSGFCFQVSLSYDARVYPRCVCVCVVCVHTCLGCIVFHRDVTVAILTACNIILCNLYNYKTVAILKENYGNVRVTMITYHF